MLTSFHGVESGGDDGKVPTTVFVVGTFLFTIIYYKEEEIT